MNRSRTSRKRQPAGVTGDQPAPRVDTLPVTRLEWRAVLLIGVGGLLLRAAVPGRMAIEHFDEGVYASNFYCGHLTPEFQFPDRHLYAPPVLPTLLEEPLRLTGWGSSVMWVNVVAGALMAPLVWWTTREWFGPTAGLVAALLAATSDYHIAFSRAALTDALLALCMLAGVFAWWRAVLTGRPLWIAGAGLLAGLAWCTKYNGWLTLAVTGSGTFGWLLVSRPRSVSWTVSVLTWCATVGIAAGLFWAIALRGLADLGGYGAVAENHGRYFTGLSDWLPNLLQHYAGHRVLDGWAAWIGLALAIAAAGSYARERFTWNGRGALTTALLTGIACASAAILVGTSLVLTLVVVAGALLWWNGRGRQSSKTRRGGEEIDDQQATPAARQLPGWLLAAWFIGLFVGTPLYHPYPRLSVTWLVAAWIATAWGLSHALPIAFKWMSPVELPGSQSQRRAAACAGTLALVAVAVWGLTLSERVTAAAWDDRTGMESAALQILRRIEQEPLPSQSWAARELNAVIYVYAEPALFFQLESSAGSTNLTYVTQPAGNLSLLEPGAIDSRFATYLVIGPHAQRAGIDRTLESAGVQLLDEFDYRPSTLVRLDESPQAVLESPASPTERVRLYLLNNSTNRR